MFLVIPIKVCLCSGCITGDRVGQLAVIARTNYEVFREAVAYCKSQPDNTKVAFIGVCN